MTLVQFKNRGFNRPTTTPSFIGDFFNKKKKQNKKQFMR